MTGYIVAPGSVAFNTEYAAAIEIASETYDLTETGDGVGYRYRDSDGDRKRLAAIIREDVPNVQAVDVTRRYVLVRAAGDARTRPNDVLDPLESAAGRFNNEYARRNPMGPGYLDGVHFGEFYIEAIQRDPDARQRFMDRHVPDGADHAPGVEEPLFNYAQRPEPTAPPADHGKHRQFDTEVIVPVSPDLWEPETYRRELEQTYSFELTDRMSESMQAHLDRRASGTFDLELWPSHLHVTVAIRSLARAPYNIMDSLLGIVLLANNHKGLADVEGAANAAVLAPRLEFGRRAYIGSTLPPAESGIEAWLDERGLLDPEPTGEPDEPPDEAPGDDAAEASDAADDGGRTTAGRLRNLLSGGQP